MFTKQHYEKIAEILRGNWNQGNLSDGQLEDLALDFATYFEHDNPRFDRVRFLRAIKEGKEE